MAAALVGGALAARAASPQAKETSDSVPVHYLEDVNVPAEYRYFILDTTAHPASRISFTGDWVEADGYRWPLSKSSTVKWSDVGTWTDAGGKKHSIDMTLSIVDWNGMCMEAKNGTWWIYIKNGDANVPSTVLAKMGSTTKAADSSYGTTLKATFTASDGTALPADFHGVTGFNDIDGPVIARNTRSELVELVSGFDGAYILKNAQLERFGTNGFVGIVQEAGDESNVNSGRQPLHRVAATWTGTSFTFRWGGHADDSHDYHTVFGAPMTADDLKWTLTAKVVDDDGNVLQTIEAGRTIRLGDTWDIEPPAIPGWEYVGPGKGSDPLKGSVGYDNLRDESVTLVYQRAGVTIPGGYLKKTDFDTGEGLAGATFQLKATSATEIDGKTYKAGDVIKTITTGDDGAFPAMKLQALRTYSLVETKAPAGHVVAAKPWTLTVDANGYVTVSR